jgi:hypothetical protein
MSGADFFEQELRGRIEEYVMRPSEELWAKIESTLPGYEKRQFLFKKYILLFPLLVLSISFAKEKCIWSKNMFIKIFGVSNYTQAISTNKIFKSEHAKINEPEFAGNHNHLPLREKKNSFNNESSIHHLLTATTGLIPVRQVLNPGSFSLPTTPLFRLYANGSNQHKPTRPNPDHLDLHIPELKQSTNKKKKALFVYFSPSISDRSFVRKKDFSYANMSANGYNRRIIYDPALGWEAGLSYLRTIKPGMQIRSGIQFNYSCYTITASQGAPELSSLTQNGIRRIQRISNLENRDGFKNQKYPNIRYQVSIPVGLMIQLYKKAKSNLIMGVSVQPAYQVHASAYLLSSNYRNYVEAPDMLRKFNVFSGTELLYSYKAGNYQIIAGPQIRYQLLSGHKKEYIFRENLVDYGLKLGIIKDLP